MEMLAPLLAAFLCFTGTQAYLKWDENDFNKEIVGAEAQPKESIVQCPTGTWIAHCRCKVFDHCNGAHIRFSASGEQCVAFTRPTSNTGAVAVAKCQRLLITMESESGKASVAECPHFYNMIGCSLHSNWMQNFPLAYLSRSAQRCYPLGGCDKCRVQARCIRVGGFA